MNVLTLNCGSSSVKFKIFAVDSDRFRVLGEGVEEVSDRHGPVLSNILKGLTERVDVIAHRVVHGGERFRASTMISPPVLQEIQTLCELAPLHNPPALDGIKAASKLKVPMVAVFDTSFFASLPSWSRTYALPKWVREDLGVKRYGFHGISHQYVLERYEELSASKSPSLISLHLGNGCSAAAVHQGQPVDTSMGFTPVEGLVMGSRPGDMDPAIILYLLRQGRSLGELEALLNRESGLKGLANTKDMRELLVRKDDEAKTAIEIFCYRIRKYVGAYLAALNGAEAIVFTGRIGERSAEIRRRVCQDLSWFGLTLDVSCAEISEGRISTSNSKLHAYVIPTDEERLMAREAVRVLNTDKEER